MALGAALAIYGGASILNAYFAGEEQAAENKALEYNARAYLNDAETADAKAEFAAREGERIEGLHWRDVKALEAKQITGYAASGVVVSSGSAVDVFETTEMLAEEEAQTIRHNAAMEVRGYKKEAESLRERARIARASKRSEEEAMGKSLPTSGLNFAGLAAFGG